ncbi:MAG: hypothetical protein PW843_02975 [Azospirillaceae bacterium]|nr:hypothetical protein [Azospirillaceae bacterium]
MLSLITAPFRLLFRLVVFLILMAGVLVVVFPYAVDLPAWARRVMADSGAGPGGVTVSAVPEVRQGFPAHLVLHDLVLANPTTPDRPSLTAATAMVEVDVLRSLTAGRLVLHTRIIEPVLYADRPFSLAGFAAGLNRALGGSGVVHSLSIEGGRVRLAGKGDGPGIDLGGTTLEVAPGLDVVAKEKAPAAAYAGTGRDPS